MSVFTRRRARADESGAAAVEFALVVPLLITLLFGIISFGIVFAQQLALNNGVRQGARNAVVVGNGTQQGCAQVVSDVRSSTGPAINMDTSAIHMTVVTQAADATSTTAPRPGPCGTGTDPTSTMPAVCAKSLQSDGSVDSIKVDATYQTSLLLPLPIPGGGPTFTLHATAVYRCEFS